MRTASIAQRMSWASRRKTKRQEDIAYCLMGIFDVNMPLIYGEGNRAFIRLQEEILKRVNDESIFAWSNQGSNRPFGIHQTKSECIAVYSRSLPDIFQVQPQSLQFQKRAIKSKQQMPLCF